MCKIEKNDFIYFLQYHKQIDFLSELIKHFYIICYFFEYISGDYISLTGPRGTFLLVTHQNGRTRKHTG